MDPFLKSRYCNTLAIFSFSGKKLEIKDEFIICINGFQINWRDCLIIVIGMPSSPAEKLFSKARIISFNCFSFIGLNLKGALNDGL